MDVELQLAPRADLVRTARLVAGTAARRAGVAEDAVDDVRLAVGVAAARAVVRHGGMALSAPVLVQFLDAPHTFTVRVHDVTDPAQPDDDEGLALAMVASLAGAHALRGTSPDGSVLEMSWPLDLPAG